jgi:polyisoprenoid-binding protein YceI
MTTTLDTKKTEEASLSGTYTIDEAHTRIGFSARHAMITKVRGSFDEFSGEGVLDVENPSASSVEIVIKAASIDTRNATRDEHLRSNDLLNIAEFPELTFKSTKVSGDADLNLTVEGDLTIKGITKTVVITFEYTGAATDPSGNHRIGFEGKSKINRSDYGVSLNVALETGGVLVSEEIGLEFEISAIKKA